MSADQFPHWLKLSLNKIVKDGACEAIPGIIVDQDGHGSQADGGTEEWVRVHVLTSQSDTNKPEEWRGDFFLQVSCFSRYGEDRRDRKIHRPSEIAALISAQISSRKHLVMDHDADSPVERGNFWIPKPKTTYLDEAELAQGSNQGEIASNIHSEVLSYRGQAVNKEY